MGELLGGLTTTTIGGLSTAAGIGTLVAAIAAPEIIFPVIMAGAIGTAATIGGGISFATGISDMYEGGNNIYNGFAGISTPAFNPIRDTIFGGNESSYRATQMVGLGLASAGVEAAPMAIPLVSSIAPQGIAAGTW